MLDNQVTSKSNETNAQNDRNVKLVKLTGTMVKAELIGFFDIKTDALQVATATSECLSVFTLEVLAAAAAGLHQQWQLSMNSPEKSPKEAQNHPKTGLYTSSGCLRSSCSPSSRICSSTFWNFPEFIPSKK